MFFDPIKCMLKEKLNTCNKDLYFLYDKKIRHFESLHAHALSNIEKIKNQISNITSFDQLLKVDFESYSLFYEIEHTSITYNACPLSPSNCELIFDEQTSYFQELISNILSINNNLRQYKNVVDNLKFLNKYNTDNNNVILNSKFIDNELVIVYFDLSQFKKYEDLFIYSHSMDIYLSYGHPNNNQSSFMYFEYIREEGAIKILDIFSYVRKKGHARFMLQTLEILIPLFNSIIMKINNQSYAEFKDNNENSISFPEFCSCHYYCKPISYIYGEIVPGGGITESGLRNFYQKVGYLHNNNLYKKVNGTT